jgi:hypothetical protein
MGGGSVLFAVSDDFYVVQTGQLHAARQCAL